MLTLPPLAQRSGDLPPLFRMFVERFNSVYRKNTVCDPSALAALPTFPWPGNLCQLENLCRRLVLQNPEDQILTLERLTTSISPDTFIVPSSPAPAQAFSGSDAASPSISVPSPGVFIHGHLVTYQELQAMNTAYHGKKTLIAQKLGISRSTLWRYFKMMENQESLPD